MMVLTACCPGATTKKRDTNDGSNSLSRCHNKRDMTQTTVLTACCPGATWWPSGAAAKQHDTNNDLNFLLTNRLNSLLSWHHTTVTWDSNKIMCFNSSLSWHHMTVTWDSNKIMCFNSSLSWCHMMVTWCHNKITWHKWQSLQHVVLVPQQNSMTVLTACCPGVTAKQHEQTTVLTAHCAGATWWQAGATTK